MAHYIVAIILLEVFFVQNEVIIITFNPCENRNHMYYTMSNV